MKIRIFLEQPPTDGCDPSATKQTRLPLKLFWAAFHRAHWVDISGRHGRSGTHLQKLRSPFFLSSSRSRS